MTELHEQGWRATGVISGVLAIGFVLVATFRPMSPVFEGTTACACAVGIACWLPSRTRSRMLLAIAMLASFGVTFVLVRSGAPRGAFLEETRIPHGSDLPRWSSLLPERDVALLSAPFVTTSGERTGLAPALDVVYSELERDVRFRRTSQLDTLLGAQTPARSDAHVHLENASNRWVVFLHGFGGNVVSGCWVIARAAAHVGWSTVCPSASLEGRWGASPGREIASAAVRFVRGRGGRTIVLVGYSNGAGGALKLVEERVLQVAGLVLLSGFDPSIEATRIRLPTLVLTGSEDVRFPASAIVPWATALPNRTVVIAARGDHMLLVKQRPVVERELIHFLRQFH